MIDESQVMDVMIPFGNVVGDVVTDSDRVVTDDETCRDMSALKMNRGM